MKKLQYILKWVTIASWAFTILGMLLYAVMFAYFSSQGYVTDEDIFESGISEGWWQNIIFLWFALCYLVSIPVAIISTISLLIVTIKRRRIDQSK